MLDTAKFVSGLMTALSTMVMLELPHVNVMSKLDLINKSARKQLDKYEMMGTTRAGGGGGELKQLTNFIDYESLAIHLG